MVCFVDSFGREGVRRSARGDDIVGGGSDDVVRNVWRVGLDGGGGEIGEKEILDSGFRVDEELRLGLVWRTVTALVE